MTLNLASDGGFVLNIYTFFLAVMLLLFQENDKRSRSNKEFIKLVGMLTGLVLVSAIGYVGKSMGLQGLPLRKFATFCKFALDPFGYLYLLKYIDCYTCSISRPKRCLFIHPIRLFAYLNLSLTTVSAIYNFGFFYFYAGRNYFRGPLYTTRSVLHILMCALTFMYVIAFRECINNHFRLPIMAFPVIVAIGSALQVLFALELGYAATVFACLILFIYVQKRDVNLDYLTGIVNRRGLDMAMQKAICESDEKDFAAIMVDVDYFKTINDRFGHRVGDEVLERIADVLLSAFNDGDIVGRFGGDEFCVITSINDAKELERRIKSLKSSVAGIDWRNKGEHDLSVSTGVAVYERQSGMRVKEFQEHIDKLMYEEKIRHHLSDRRKAEAV